MGERRIPSAVRSADSSDSRLVGSAIDWIIAFWLAGTIAYSVWCLGGHYPASEAVQSVLIGVLLMLHGIWMAAQPERPLRLNALGLIFLPFIFYSIVSLLFVTSMPWRGREEFYLLVQGCVVFWVAIHNLRGKRHIWFLLSAITLCGLVSLSFAAAQFYYQSDWLPLGRVQLSQYSSRAWGTFGAPNNFGAFMGLLASSFLLVACTQRLRPLLRLVAALLAILFVGGLIISGSRGGWIGMVCVLVALPYFMSGQPWVRIKAWVATIAGGVVLGFLVYLSFDMVRDRFDNLIRERGEPSRRWVWKVGWEIFKDYPLEGSGIGSYELAFAHYRPPEAQVGPRYAHNDYLNTLSDGGLVGFVLFFGPAGYLVWRGWRSWRVIPFLALPKGERHGVVPTSKVVLGCVLLSLIGFGVHLLVDFHLKIPALLYIVALLFGLLVKFSSRRDLRLRRRAAIPFLYISLGVVLGAFTAHQGLKTYMSAAWYLKGKEGLKKYIREREELRGNAEYLQELREKFEEALGWDENHGWAWTDLSLVVIQTYFVDRRDRNKIGEEALDAAKRAIAVSDRVWNAHAHAGMALAMQRRFDEARPFYERAVALSPSNPAAWVYFARFLNIDPSRKSETLAAVAKVLMLDPNNRYGIALKKSLSVN